MQISRTSATPKTFIPLTSGSKSRIFAYGAAVGHARSTLEQVTTVNLAADDAWALVDALNHAAWTGETSALSGRLADLPPAVVQSCTEALSRCPAPRDLFLGMDGQPLSVVRTTYFTDVEEVADYMIKAVDFGLQLVVTNESEHHRTWFAATLLSSEVEVDHDDAVWRIAPPDGAKLLAREYPAEGDLVEALRDGRWDTYRSRAYWLWVRDEDDPSQASVTFVMEHFHQLIEPDATFLDFSEVDDADEELRGPVTPRNRFMLYTSLLNVVNDLESLRHDWDTWDSQVRDDMPALVRHQPREWWQQMERSADRLCEAARQGAIADLVPRTPAEEALLYLATRRGYLDWASDTARDYGTRAVFEVLPRTKEWDEEFDEILPFLTGDADIEMLWSRSLIGIEDPSDPANQNLGMGDYRPQSWHRLFDRAIRSASPDPLDAAD